MKGKYINTVITMAALSGRKIRQAVAQKEIIRSLNNYKIIWHKSSNVNKTITGKPQVAQMD